MIDDCCNIYPHDAQCPYAPEEPEPTCPECGNETDVFYFTRRGLEIIGCDECLIARDAHEVPAEMYA